MTIKFGGSSLSSIKLGETEVNKMYMGDTLVYEKAVNIPGAWTMKKDMYTGFRDHSCVAVDNKIYSIGGAVDGNQYTRNVQCYDTDTDTWTTKESMPTHRNSLCAEQVNGLIYAIGGEGERQLSTVECYNPATNTWSAKKSMPTARRGMMSAVVDNKIYILGGYLYPDGLLDKVECYDPATDTWTTKANMLTGKQYAAASVANNKIYVFGSYDSIVDCYDATTDTWERMPKSSPTITPRTSLSSASLGDKIYAIGGGSDPNTPLSIVECYDPASNSWNTKASMNLKRINSCSTSANGKIYAISGNSRGFTATVECYDANGE